MLQQYMTKRQEEKWCKKTGECSEDYKYVVLIRGPKELIVGKAGSIVAVVLVMRTITRWYRLLSEQLSPYHGSLNPPSLICNFIKLEH